MNRLVLMSMALSFTLPAMFFLVERRVRARGPAPVTPLVAVGAGGGAPRS
jgi:hypothetical protein